MTKIINNLHNHTIYETKNRIICHDGYGSVSTFNKGDRLIIVQYDDTTGNCGVQLINAQTEIGCRGEDIDGIIRFDRLKEFCNKL